MSDLQSHLSTLESHIDNLPGDTNQDLVDALGEIYFLLEELRTIVVDLDAKYDK